MKTRFSRFLLVALVSATSLISVKGRAEEWPQLQGDALRSGNAASLDVANSIGLVAAIPLTDGIVAAPVVSAVVVEPWGAHPSYSQGYYDRDNDFYVNWDAISKDRDRFHEWMDTYVFATADFAECMAKLKENGHA